MLKLECSVALGLSHLIISSWRVRTPFNMCTWAFSLFHYFSEFRHLIVESGPLTKHPVYRVYRWTARNYITPSQTADEVFVIAV